MFERFTDRARRVVVLAQEEARLLNHNYIGTEHLLLGLLGEADGIAARALVSLGVSLEAVRAGVEELIGVGGSSPNEGHIPFTPRAKKVLEYALREALQLGHNYIGTEHIALGLVREGGGVAAQVLTGIGVDLAGLRAAVVEILGVEAPEPIGMGEAEAEAVAERSRELVVDSLRNEVRRLRDEVDRLRDELDRRHPETRRRLEAPEPRLTPSKPALAPSEYQTLLKCSFCDTPQEDVAKLIAGPGVYICDRCIALCQDIIDEELPPPDPRTD